jgi:hypothetical protein
MAGTPYPAAPTGGPFPPTFGSALGSFMQGFAASVGARVQEAQEQWKQQHALAQEQYQAALAAWQARMQFAETQMNQIYQNTDMTPEEQGKAVQQLVAEVGPMPQPPASPPFPTVQGWVQNLFHRAPVPPGASPTPPGTVPPSGVAPTPPAPPAPAQPGAQPAPAQPGAQPAPAQPGAQPAPPTTSSQPGQMPVFIPPPTHAMTVAQAHDQFVGKPDAKAPEWLLKYKEDLWQKYFAPYITSGDAPLSSVFKRMAQAGIPNPGEMLAEIRAGASQVVDPETGEITLFPNDPKTGKPDPVALANAGYRLTAGVVKDINDRYAKWMGAILADSSLTPQERVKRLNAVRTKYYETLSRGKMSRGDIDSQWQTIQADAKIFQSQIAGAELVPVLGLDGKPMTYTDARGRVHPMMLPAAQAFQANSQMMQWRAERADKWKMFEVNKQLEQQRIQAMHDDRLESRAGRLLSAITTAQAAYDKAEEAMVSAIATWQTFYDPATGALRTGADPTMGARARQNLDRATAAFKGAQTKLTQIIQTYNSFVKPEPGLPDPTGSYTFTPPAVSTPRH